VEDALLLVVVGLLAAYLLFALVRPERF